MDMLTVSNVKKSFGSKSVIKDLSFSIPENSIFGFVGQNGAGKTTTMKMILGLVKMDAGEIYVGGEKVCYGNTPTNKIIGYLPDVPEFYSFMTPREYLTFCGEITGMKKEEIKERVEELLVLVGLEKEKRKITGFSRGMKQRLGIAQALMGRPKLLICDEPTSALDPVGRKEILDILVAAKKETTVMFSTHILSDVERICDEIVFLHNGTLALSGTMDEVRAIRKNEGFNVVLENKEDVALLEKTFKIISNEDGSIEVEPKNTMSFTEFMQYIVDNKIAVEKLEKCEMSLEKLFMEVIGK